MESRGYKKDLVLSITLVLFILTIIQIFSNSKVYAVDCIVNKLNLSSCTCWGSIGSIVPITSENLAIAINYDTASSIGQNLCADDKVANAMLANGAQSACPLNKKINNCFCDATTGLTYIFNVTEINVFIFKEYDNQIEPGQMFCADLATKSRIDSEIQIQESRFNRTQDAPADIQVNQATQSSDFRYVPQSGVQCVVNYADCGPDFSNLFEDINNGRVKLFNITQANFTQVFTKRAPELKIEKICYDKSVYSGDIIAFSVPNSTALGILSNFLRGQPGDSSTMEDVGYIKLEENLFPSESGWDLISDTFVSACTVGTRATKSVFSFGINTAGIGFLGSQNPYNCCPKGYSFVNQANQSTLGDAGVGVCCQGNSNDFKAGDANSCTKNDGTVISLNNNNKSNNLATFISDISQSRPLSPIYGGGMDGNTLSQSYITWGIPLLGQALLGQLVRESVPTAPSQICPDSYPVNSCVRGVTGDDNIYSKNNYDQQDSWQCTKCYLPGEAIRVESQKLHICDTSQPYNYREEDLINGNVNDTIAYLQADEENQPELKSCREQGGLYIAIGCVDPTPIGIITGAIRISFGVLGGVALLQIILAGIAYQSGEEARIQTARNRVFATIGGVSLLVFSVLVLRIIGVNVLDVVPSTFF